MLIQVYDFQNNDPVICNTTRTICHIAKCQSLGKNGPYSSLGFPRGHYSWGNSEQQKIPLPFASQALHFLIPDALQLSNLKIKYGLITNTYSFHKNWVALVFAAEQSEFSLKYSTNVILFMWRKFMNPSKAIHFSLLSYQVYIQHLNLWTHTF